MVSVVSDTPYEVKPVAAAFVTARRQARPLAAYPSSHPPTDLMTAYRVQDEAIASWPDVVAGWKVGWIPEPFGSRFGEQRLVGPIFHCALYQSNGVAPLNVAVFAGGFAAIEAEFVFRLAADAPADRVRWSDEAAAELVDRMYVGIEIASSPLATINDLGATAIISDFGNNAGLILGPEVPGWNTRALESLTCECRIEGESVGRGTAASVSGGPLAALAFALRCNAERGRPLRRGDYVTTGAATGVHNISVGQRAEAVFHGLASLRCIAVPAAPVASGDTRDAR